MGTRVLEFPISDQAGTTLLVEVDDPGELGNRPVGRDMAERARQSLEAALSDVMPGVNALTARLQDLAKKPDEVALEFGVKFTAEAGALIAKTSLEGNIKVSIKWANK
jgi:hypothetical protein